MNAPTNAQMPYRRSPSVCITKGVMRKETIAVATRLTVRKKEPEASRRALDTVDFILAYVTSTSRDEN